MKSPSVKRMVEAFRISSKDARLIKKVAKAEDSGEQLEKVINRHCPRTAEYVRRMHSSPYNSGIWRTTVALHAINDLVGGSGVEGLGPARSGDYAPPYEYINMGDPYVNTLMYRRASDNLYIGGYGSVAEKHPNW